MRPGRSTGEVGGHALTENVVVTEVVCEVDNEDEFAKGLLSSGGPSRDDGSLRKPTAASSSLFLGGSEKGLEPDKQGLCMTCVLPVVQTITYGATIFIVSGIAASLRLLVERVPEAPGGIRKYPATLRDESLLVVARQLGIALGCIVGMLLFPLSSLAARHPTWHSMTLHRVLMFSWTVLSFLGIGALFIPVRFFTSWELPLWHLLVIVLAEGLKTIILSACVVGVWRAWRGAKDPEGQGQRDKPTPTACEWRVSGAVMHVLFMGEALGSLGVPIGLENLRLLMQKTWSERLEIVVLIAGLVVSLVEMTFINFMPVPEALPSYRRRRRRRSLEIEMNDMKMKPKGKRKPCCRSCLSRLCCQLNMWFGLWCGVMFGISVVCLSLRCFLVDLFATRAGVTLDADLRRNLELSFVASHLLGHVFATLCSVVVRDFVTMIGLAVAAAVLFIVSVCIDPSSSLLWTSTSVFAFLLGVFPAGSFNCFIYFDVSSTVAHQSPTLELHVLSMLLVSSVVGSAGIVSAWQVSDVFSFFSVVLCVVGMVGVVAIVVFVGSVACVGRKVEVSRRETRRIVTFNADLVDRLMEQQEDIVSDDEVLSSSDDSY